MSDQDGVWTVESSHNEKGEQYLVVKFSRRKNFKRTLYITNTSIEVDVPCHLWLQSDYLYNVVQYTLLYDMYLIMM